LREIDTTAIFFTSPAGAPKHVGRAGTGLKNYQALMSQRGRVDSAVPEYSL
jgi:hypothetical protein